jgi:hypothetical protein
VAPFDPANIDPNAPLSVPLETLGKAAVFECGLCGRARFYPYEIAYAGEVVWASGRPVACGFCGDGCFQ